MLFADAGSVCKAVQRPFFVQATFDNSPRFQQTFVTAKWLRERKHIAVYQIAPFPQDVL